MRLNDPINIMQSCCIPDKRTLMEAISRLQPGEVLRVEIDNCVASKAMVESYLKNKWCRIEQIVEDERTSILHIRLDLKA